MGLWIIKDCLVQTTGVLRIFDNFRKYVVLLFKANVFHRQSDLITVFNYMYVPPENSPVYTQEHNGITLLNEYINEILLRHPNADLFLEGDFNSHIGDLITLNVNKWSRFKWKEG